MNTTRRQNDEPALRDILETVEAQAPQDDRVRAARDLYEHDGPQTALVSMAYAIHDLGLRISTEARSEFERLVRAHGVESVLEDPPRLPW
jgi:hypothetical protein